MVCKQCQNTVALQRCQIAEVSLYCYIYMPTTNIVTVAPLQYVLIQFGIGKLFEGMHKTWPLL